MTQKKRKYRILTRGTAIVLVVGLVVSLVIARKNSPSYQIFPPKTSIHIPKDSKTQFLSSSDVYELLPFSPNDSTHIHVDLDQIERTLVESSPYIQRAEVYVSPSTSTLNVHIHQRYPLLTYYLGQQAYYLDSDGESISCSVGTSAYVPVAIGAITPDVVSQVLYPLANFLHADSDWTNYFSLIEVKSPTCIHLYPRIGDFVFELNGVKSLKKDLNKIPIFYSKIVPHMGANRYRIIKLSYKNQIVCQKRK